MRTTASETLQDFRNNWRALFLTDVVYKIVSFLLLTPLLAFSLRGMIWASGNPVLADQDILFFLLGPLGWICFVTVGAISLGIVALELAALMFIMRGDRPAEFGPFSAIRFASRHAWPIWKVAARIMALTLLTAAPFLAIAGVVYVTLLGEFDINFYLKEKPPVFLVAIAIGFVLVATLAGVLLRLFSGWIFALPLVLFEGIAPNEALAESRHRAEGFRRKLVTCIAAWFLITAAISAFTSWLVVEAGRMLIPRAQESLAFLTLAIGAVLLVWSAVGMAVNLLSTTTFAVMLHRLYRNLAADPGRCRQISEQVSGRFMEGQGAAVRLTRTRILLGGVVVSVIACGIGLTVIGDIPADDRVVIMAHRGASVSTPENTMASIRAAIEGGADFVEIDVQETADGEVVVIHDSDFMKLSGNPLKIWDANLADLKSIDVGSWFDPKFQSERVPTLATVLEECKGKIGVNIELKYYGHDVDLERRVVSLVESAGMADSIVVMSLKLDAVKKMKSIRPQWKTGLLMSVAAGDLRNMEADFLAVNAAFATRKFVRDAHSYDKEVFVWTVNDAIGISSMLGRGVDGLITDDPVLARKVLAERSELNFAERVLLQLADQFGIDVAIAPQ